MDSLRTYFSIFALCIALMAVAACTNTFKGIGQDVEGIGERMQESFEE